MFFTENKQTRGGSRATRSTMMELLVTVGVIPDWQSSSNLDDGGIVELPLYASSVSMIKLESWRRTKTKRTQVFRILASSFFSRSKEYNFLLPLLRNSCSLIDPFVFWRFCELLFESIPLFWKYSNNLQECSKRENVLFETWNLFSHQFWLKKTVSRHQSRGKQTSFKTYISIWHLISKNARTYIDVFANRRCDY